MAASLLLLLDDIAGTLDDVAALTKVAAHKTAGVVGDDLALNAKQVAGMAADRELPVIWAVAKGSLLNKLILVPAALGLSAVAPWAITPLLLVGGAYLCFEGAEKIWHAWSHRRHPAAHRGHPHQPSERERIAGATRTDFILSAEIIVIALGVAASSPFAVRAAVLAAIGLGMTVGVYGLVAAIVKLDDLGLWLAASRHAGPRIAGRALVAAAPWLMRGLAIAGTVAMFLVGGGLVVHAWPALHRAVHDAIHSLPAAGLLGAVIEATAGLAVGGLLLAAASLPTIWHGRRERGGHDA
jgi:predicted DNA repair protein MutK